MSYTILNEELIFHYIIIKFIILNLKLNNVRYFNYAKNNILNIIILSKIKFKKDIPIKKLN